MLEGMWKVRRTNPDTTHRSSSWFNFRLLVKINSCLRHLWMKTISFVSWVHSKVEFGLGIVGSTLLRRSSSFNKLLSCLLCYWCSSPMIDQTTFTFVNFIVTEWWDVIYCRIPSDCSLDVKQTELVRFLLFASSNFLQKLQTFLLPLPSIFFFGNAAVSRSWRRAVSLLWWFERTFFFFNLVFNLDDRIHVYKFILEDVHERIAEARDYVRGVWIFVYFKLLASRNCDCHRSRLL